MPEAVLVGVCEHVIAKLNSDSQSQSARTYVQMIGAIRYDLLPASVVRATYSAAHPAAGKDKSGGTVRRAHKIRLGKGQVTLWWRRATSDASKSHERDAPAEARFPFRLQCATPM